MDVVLETYQTDCGDASSAEFTTKRGEKRRGDGYLSVFFFFFFKDYFLVVWPLNDGTLRSPVLWR